MKKQLTEETSTTVIIYHVDEGFLEIITKEDVLYTLDHAIKDFETAKKLINSKKMPVLSRPGKMQDHKDEVSKYFASKEMANNITAMAVLTETIAVSIIGNFFMKFNKPHYPTRLFNNREAAIEWLKKHS